MPMVKQARDWTGYDLVGALMDYETGNQSAEDSIKLFQYLVDTGTAWKLQGHYGRTATGLLEKGLVAQPGKEPAKMLGDYRQ